MGLKLLALFCIAFHINVVFAQGTSRAVRIFPHSDTITHKEKWHRQEGLREPFPVNLPRPVNDTPYHGYIPITGRPKPLELQDRGSYMTHSQPQRNPGPSSFHSRGHLHEHGYEVKPSY